MEKTVDLLKAKCSLLLRIYGYIAAARKLSWSEYHAFMMSQDLDVPLNSLREILAQIPDPQVKEAIEFFERARGNYPPTALKDKSLFVGKDFDQRVIKVLEHSLEQSVRNYKEITALKLKRFKEQSQQIPTTEKKHTLLSTITKIGGIALVVATGTAIARSKGSKLKKE